MFTTCNLILRPVVLWSMVLGHRLYQNVGNLVTMAKDENVSTQAPQGQTAGFRSKSFFYDKTMTHRYVEK